MAAKDLFVVGHKNPDTDSVCSAIAYAGLKGILTGENYIPCRAGEINRETAFVLDYFQAPVPALLEDIRSRVTDMLTGSFLTVQPSTTLHEVGLLSHKQQIKSIAVVDNNGLLLGIVTMGDIAERYMNELSLGNLASMDVNFSGIVNTLKGKFLVDAPDNLRPDGNVVIATMDHESMGSFIRPGDVVIVGDREKAQLAAIELGADCLIITGGFEVSGQVMNKAAGKGIPVISVPFDSFATARLINMSIPVSALMKTQDIITFNPDDLVTEAKKTMLDTRFRNYPVVDENNRYMGMISRYNILALMNKKVVLVDHNEKSQSVEGLEEADIIEVVDHHRVGDVETGEPIYFRNEPLGSTATIVAGMYRESFTEPDKTTAGLLLAAILSDTVIFKSPTCTPRDKQTALELARICGVDPYEFGQQMFKAGTSLAGCSYEDIIFTDFKEFSFGEATVGIGQVNTMDTEAIDRMKAELLAVMEKFRQDKNYYYVLLMATDILAEGTKLLMAGNDKSSLKKAYGVDFVNGEAFLTGVMSRKKQIVPPLARVLNK